MEIKGSRFLMVVILALTSCQGREKKPQLVLKIDKGNAESIWYWFDHLDNSDAIEAIVNEPGSQIMAENVRLSSELSSIESFSEELTRFSKGDSMECLYGTDLAWQYRVKSRLLMDKIQSEGIENKLIERAFAFMPQDYQAKTTANIYFVLTGWEWGDAFVCSVNESQGKYVIADEGVPSIVINLSLFAKLYGETPGEQFEVLQGVLSHELFHFVFADYKKEAPLYSEQDTTLVGKLFERIHNEGIAHYVDKRSVLTRDYGVDMKLIERERSNFNVLNDAFSQLVDDTLLVDQKNELLRKASVGKYWFKYGAMSGMFMAYHIEKLKGVEGLRESIQRGPIHFIRQYHDLQVENERLPKISDQIKIYLDQKTRQIPL